MKKFKRLNRKGFTLIELLAVIVILAVVMGIAANSVLNSMNNSKKSSLQNSALSAADAFRTAYAEYSFDSSKGILGITDANKISNLLSGSVVSLSEYKDGLSITVGADSTTSNYLTFSAVKFDSINSKFTVCVVANPKGSYYVDAYAKTAQTKKPGVVSGSMTNATKYMWACSDNSNSWT